MYPFQYALWRKRRASTVDGFRAVLLWLKVSPAALKFLSLLLLLAGMLNILRASLDSNGKTPLLFFHQPKRSRSSSMSWLRLMYWWNSSTVSFRGTFTHSSNSATTVLLLLLAGSTAGSPPPVKLAIRRLDSWWISSLSGWDSMRSWQNFGHRNMASLCSVSILILRFSHSRCR